MKVCRTISELREARSELEGRVGFVPTMGALHEGHLSLVDLARTHAEAAVSSVFVNPTQFNDPSDFEKYPRTLDDDLAMLEGRGVSLVFAPEAAELYPTHVADVTVDVPALTMRLEGEHRPGHFAGVCRVVLKLFNIVQPDVAVFGRKDFQQLQVLRAMTQGLDLPIEIVAGPTLREGDSLAMSSRNARLTAEDRRKALAISRSLHAAIDSRQSLRELERDVRHRLDAAGLRVDYVEAVDAATLRPADARPAVLAAAAYAGEVRLIDNVDLPSLP